MKFYKFNQNNSGGIFNEDDHVGQYVFIEANNVSEAIIVAEKIGIYFDGCSSGLDCRCCGDRWHPPDEDGESTLDLDSISPYGFSLLVHIYYENGKHEMISASRSTEKSVMWPKLGKDFDVHKKEMKPWK